MKQYKIDYLKLREQMEGHWGEAYAVLAPELECALERLGRHVPCPIHGGKDGFRFYEKDFEKDGGAICNTCGPMPNGFQVLQWLRGWSFYEALVAVDEFRNGGGMPVIAHPGNGRSMAVKAPRKDDGNLRKLLNRIGSEAVPLDFKEAEPGKRYLESRGITFLPPDGLRYHPSLTYFDEDGKEQGKYPGLLAILTDVHGRSVTLHRIYLTPDGRKAPVAFPKKTMPYPASIRELTGAAVKLEPVKDLLGVAEGIETALAVTQATGMVCWATTSATLLRKIILPAQVKRVVVWADHDTSKERAGQVSAELLAARLKEEGRKVRVEIPPPPPAGRKSMDWADVLLEQGKEGFPKTR